MTYELVKNGPLQQHLIQIHEVDFALAEQKLAGTKYDQLSKSNSMAERLAALAAVVNVIEFENAPKPKEPSPILDKNGSPARN